MITLSPCIRVSGVLYTPPDTGVEYGYVYFRYRFCQNLPLDKQKRLHTFFFLQLTILQEPKVKTMKSYGLDRCLC